MFKTRITELFGIKYPIIGGTMMWLSNAEFVAAVSNAGGLGVLASAMFEDKEAFRNEIRRTKSLTDKPFAVNLNLFPSFRPVSNDTYIDVILEEGVDIIETSGARAPEEFMDRLKGAGVTMVHKCVGVRYAKKVEKLGVDAVTVVGYENGGATGMLDIGSLVLIPRVVEEVNIPVIGGGGVADGRGLLALLALGAEGVIVGTRLLLSEECPLHPRIKEALIEATEVDTHLIMRSIRATHRVWKNAKSSKVKELEERGAGLEELEPHIRGDNARDMFQSGDTEKGTLACGQAVGLVKSIDPVKKVFDDMINEAIEIRNRLMKMTKDN